MNTFKGGGLPIQHSTYVGVEGGQASCVRETGFETACIFDSSSGHNYPYPQNYRRGGTVVRGEVRVSEL